MKYNMLVPGPKVVAPYNPDEEGVLFVLPLPNGDTYTETPDGTGSMQKIFKTGSSHPIVLEGGGDESC